MTPHINRTYLTPRVVHHGLDYLVLGQELACSSEVRRTVLDSECAQALSRLGHPWTRGALREEGDPGAIFAKYELGSVTLLLQAERHVQAEGGRTYRLLALCGIRHIHEDGRAVCQRAVTLLTDVAHELEGTGLVAVSSHGVYLHEVHLFADVVGWACTRRMESEFVSKYRGKKKDHGEDGRVFLGFALAGALRVYFKSYLVAQRPGAQWILPFWAHNGWETGQCVWRVEFVFDRDRLRELGTDLDRLWQTALDDTWLPARARPGDCRPGYRRPEAGIWRLLRRVEFTPPWEAVPAPGPATVPPPMNPKALKGLLRFAVAGMLDANLPDEGVVSAAMRLLEAILEDPEQRTRLLIQLRRR